MKKIDTSVQARPPGSINSYRSFLSINSKGFEPLKLHWNLDENGGVQDFEYSTNSLALEPIDNVHNNCSEIKIHKQVNFFSHRLTHEEKRIPLPPIRENAGVVKLVDTLDLGSSAARRGGSSPSTRTSKNLAETMFSAISNRDISKYSKLTRVFCPK